MVETKKVSAGKVSHRIRTKLSWMLATALLVSVAANLNFANRVLYLDTNHPFHPICFTEADGFVVLTEPMNEKYMEHVLTSRDNSKRLGTDGVIYISLRDWTNDQDEIWNLTRQIAERIYFERTGKILSAKEAMQKLTGRRKFIRKYVLKNPKAQ